MPSHDKTPEECRAILTADKKAAHVHVYEYKHTYLNKVWAWLNYCSCGKWEQE